MESSPRKKHNTEGSYSFAHTLFLNEGITTRPRLEYCHFSLGFLENASKTMSENLTSGLSVCLRTVGKDV